MDSTIKLLLLKYFRFFARLQLKKINPKIIGVTGSAGKSITRNAILAVLKAVPKAKIKVSYKANSQTGIPLNILDLSPKDYSLLDWLRLAVMSPLKYLTNHKKYNYYVVELGIDSPFPPKNMEYLISIVQPDIGVFLNARPLHSEAFDELTNEQNKEKRKKEISKLIALEKGKMITGLPSKENGGVAILNTDDPNVSLFSKKTLALTTTFGKDKNNTIQILKSKYSLKKTVFFFRVKNKEYQLTMNNMLLPNHYAYSFAAALEVALSQKVNISQAIMALEKHFKLPPGRSSIIPGINKSYILDSSYNASAQPIIDALELVKKVSKGRKIALLGDIRESGKETQIEHEVVAKKIITTCDLVVLVGPAMKKYVLPILKRNNIQVEWFKTAGKAGRYLKNKLQKDDLTLIKGSQNTLFMEIAVKILMNDPSKAEELLCRRGKFWDKRRVGY